MEVIRARRRVDTAYWRCMKTATGLVMNTNPQNALVWVCTLGDRFQIAPLSRMEQLPSVA